MATESNLKAPQALPLVMAPFDVSPCACCAPAVSLLNCTMKVTDQELCKVEHWHSKAPPPAAISVNTRIFVNAKIITVDAAFSFADAMAIKDTKIVAMGEFADLREAYPSADIIDCEGKTILPGFIEPHMHLLPIATIGQYEDVGPFVCPAIEDALIRLGEMVSLAEPDEWVVARQIDPSLQSGAADLDRHMLDRVSATQPVFVYNASLHFAYCNTVALQIAGINKNTPDELSSSYGRAADGTPNGVLQGGRAMAAVIRHNPAQQAYDLASACLAVGSKANKVGITTLCDQGTGLGRGIVELDIYRTMVESRRMTARLRYSLSGLLQEKWDSLDVQYADGDDMVRVVGWKIVSDGSNQGLTGLQRQPYLFATSAVDSGAGDNLQEIPANAFGVAYIEADELKDMVVERAARGWPLVIHANGDQAIDNTLDAYQAAYDLGLLTNGPYRIEHCSILHDDQIQRIKTMNLSPSFLIGHVYYWGAAMRDSIFGLTKANLLDRTAACEKQGIRWTLHSDEPVTEMNPLRCIENAVTRKMWQEADSVLAVDECIDVATALRAMTRDAAWQCHSGDEIGSLEVGKYADFILLDQDPLSVPVDEIANINVTETWLAGACVYRAAV
ncbi:MAG: amidohydrolase [Pseudomonadales bacterium]|nr:amidohydrolase [Pseudomonadales bacterium]